MTNIAIIGGAGFIGSWLSQALALEHNVTIFDINAPPSHLLDTCSFERCDVREKGALQGRLGSFEVVYMLAGLLAKRSMEEPHNAWKTNVLGTTHAFEALTDSTMLRRIVFFSSSMVFDSANEQFPLDEDAPRRGENLYDQSKVIGEELLTTFCQSYGIEGLVFRFFSIYGQGSFLREKGHFIATWLDMVKNGDPIVIHGDGLQTIDLLHVDDAVAACLAGEQMEIEKGKVEIFNVGSGEDTAVKDISSWIQAVRPDAVLTYAPAPSVAIRRRWADISRAQAVLGYEPKVRPQIGVTALARSRLLGEGD